MIIIYILMGLALLYLIFNLFMAWFIAKIIYDTPKAFAPDKAKVYDELKNLLEYDVTDYDTWERKDFTVQNGGFVICGEYYPIPNPRGVAVISHGFGQNRYVMAPQASILRDLGFITIIYDQRAFGVNRGKGGSTFGEKEGEDCAKVIDWARDTFGDDKPLVLCGASMGAMSVLNSQKYTAPVDAIIEDSSPDHAGEVLKYFYRTLVPLPNPFLGLVKRMGARYGVDMAKNNPVDSASKIECPILVMHGAADRTVPVFMGKNIGSVLKNPKSHVEIFEGKDHTLEIIEYERYKKVVTGFLKDAIC